MSMHNKPLTDLEESGLKAHGLAVGTASQLSDSFRLGMNWVQSQRKTTEIKDRNGNEIFFGDTLRFADKWEWYRSPKYWFMEPEEVTKEIESLPYEERLVESIKDYEWLLSSEIQSWWEIVKPEDIQND